MMRSVQRQPSTMTHAAMHTIETIPPTMLMLERTFAWTTAEASDDPDPSPLLFFETNTAKLVRCVDVIMAVMLLDEKDAIRHPCVDHVLAA